MYVQGKHSNGGEFVRKEGSISNSSITHSILVTTVSPKKRFEQNRGDMEEWDSSRDGSHGSHGHPDSPMHSNGKRKSLENDRQPESPGDVDQHAPDNWHRDKQFRPHVEPMDTDSPASYPKHVMVPSSDSSHRYSRSSAHDSPSTKGKMTPNLTPEPMGANGMHGGYGEPPMYGRPNYYHGSHDRNHSSSNGGQYQGHGQGHTPPRPSRHYMPEMESPPHYGHHSQPDVFLRPRRWACDYCNIATFVSYEEACAHEEECARRHHEHYGGRVHPSRGPVPHYDRAPPAGGGGLGALYHASQEVGGPPVPTRKPMWGSRGPTMTPFPHDSHHPPQPHHQHQPHHPHHQHQPQHGPHGYQTPPRYHGGYRGYDGREGATQVHQHDPNYKPQKRMLLAMPTDNDSLSDRQCYVRSEMVEIFAATEKDVSARHSKGAQKLAVGQVGIRCVHCSHLRPRDRAERAVCYPSSISRIYQTVADMQRFHFEQCREIPNETRKIYKSLKTTRPRGVGSPQTYWVQSANLLDLVDSEDGIRFANDPNQAELSAQVS
jgi:hypothetical protein